MNNVLPPDDDTKTVKFLLKENLARYKLNNKGKKLKTLIIDDNQYRYNPTKPISNKLKSKLEKKRQTNEYRAYQIKELAATDTVRKFAIRKRATITEEQSAFKAYANAYTISNIHLKGLNGLTYFPYQFARLNEYLEKHKGMKLNATVKISVVNIYDEMQDVIVRTRSYTIIDSDELQEALNNMRNDIGARILDMALYQSGLMVVKVKEIHMMYNKYNPTRAGKYINLPKWISLKKACINIKNKDEKCFKYAIQCGYHKIYEKSHSENFYHYKKIEDCLNFDGVTFPANNNDIDKFEELNHNVSVNVFEVDDEQEQIVIGRKLKNKDAKCHIDSLRIDEDDISHYVYVKDCSRLLNSQKSKFRNKSYFCKYCHTGFGTQELLNKHYEKGCMEVEGQQIEMPTPDEKLKFKHHFKKLRCPFVIYADFECLTEELKQPEDDEIKTYKYQEHKPCGFMMNLVNAVDNTNHEFLYRGADAVDVFCNKINEIRNEIKERMQENKEILMTEKTKKILKLLLTALYVVINLRTHIRMKKKQRNTKKLETIVILQVSTEVVLIAFVIQNFCNRYFKIPVFFHNMKNYDGHLIIQNAEKLSNKKKIDVIAQNSGKFINIGFDSLSVKDSFSFITASLDKLVSMTKYDNTDEKERSKWVLRDNWQSNFRYSSKNDIIKTEKCLDLLTEKGVYPYDYMNAFDKFNDEQLPSKEQFYSRLTEEGITNDDYNKAKQIWKHFDIKNMGEYHDLYLKTDVLLLTDVFENFRDMCLSYYGLDPVYYYTLPNFAFDAMLKLIGIEIDLVYNQEMYEMIEAGLRGGMTQTTCKKVEANNKYMGSDYDKNKASSYINYLDANNLYGLSMIQKLPYRSLKWDDKITEDDVINYDNGRTGFILEVDLEYPTELHDLHNDYPLAPEVMNVKANMLSEKQVEIYKLINGSKEPKDEKTKKLILNLNDKSKYVVHIRSLQFFLSMV